MKKILTLLIAAGSFVTLHAQSRDESRRVIFGDPKNNGTYDRDVAWTKPANDRYPVYPNGGYANSRESQVDQVNREYDSKIYSIRNDRYLNRHEKRRMIEELERDRQNRIKDINRRFNDAKRHSDNDDCYDKKDNGKHKGWYKEKSKW